MYIRKSHLETFLFDSTLNNFIQDLLLLEDNFGINYIPSTTTDPLLLSQLQRAWTNISKRIRHSHPHVHQFLIEYSNILDKEEFAPTFLASTRILSSKIDQIGYIKTIISDTLLLVDPTFNLPAHVTSQYSDRIIANITSLTSTLFTLLHN